MRAKTVLVVDDEAHVTHVMSYKLERAGLNVLTAQDGEEGLAIARDAVPDVVVTDLQMPYVTGYELARQLRDAPATSAIPVVMVTARGHVLDEQQLAATNIKTVMAKPFAPRHLLEAVMGLINESEQGVAGVSAA